jgi:hypothetical protein
LPNGGRRWPAVSDGEKYIWVIGGRSPGSGENTDVIQRGVINPADGSVVWDTDLALPQDRAFHGAALLVLPAVEGFKVTGISRVDGQLGIEFPTTDGATHRLQKRTSLASGDWMEETFALTPGGATQTTLTGDGNPATLYVDPTGSESYYQAGRDE